MDNARLILKLSKQEAESLVDLIDTHLDMSAGGMLADAIIDSSKHDDIRTQHQVQGDAINDVINLSCLKGRLAQMIGK